MARFQGSGVGLAVEGPWPPHSNLERQGPKKRRKRKPEGLGFRV